MNKLYDEKVKPRWFIIRTSDSKFYEYWYVVVISAAIINSIWTPFTLSFEYTKEIAEDPELIFFWLDITANWIFFFDIIVQFLSSYMD